LTDNLKTLPVADVIFRDDVYPRIDKAPAKVDQYRTSLDQLPPIEVNQHNELIDGWHRWTAYREEGREQIKCVVTNTRDDGHFFELAVRRNSDHGLQLNQREKRNAGRRIYRRYDPADRDGDLKSEIADILSVNERTVRDWTKRIDKDAEREAERKAWRLYLRCHTQSEIAERVGWSQQKTDRFLDEVTQNGRISEMGNLPLAEFQDYEDEDGKRPLYNVRWEWKEKGDRTDHPGNTDSRIVERLLYLYTDPLDVVMDPFAGSGSTVRVCEERARRCFASDRKVTPKSEDLVREHDITDGLPNWAGRTWSDVKLVYLDPPYWRQAAGEYSDDPTDLANMDLEDFHDTLVKIVRGFAEKLRDARIALIIQPTQWRAPGRRYTDHVAHLLSNVDLPVAMRIQAPYESQQANAQMVEWAKEHRSLLALNRELVVWSID